MENNNLSRVFIGSKINIGQDFYDSLIFPGSKTDISLLHITYYFYHSEREIPHHLWVG